MGCGGFSAYIPVGCRVVLGISGLASRALEIRKPDAVEKVYSAEWSVLSYGMGSDNSGPGPIHRR